MTSGWPLWAFLIFNGGPFVLIVIGIIYNLYLTYRHLNDMLDALKNSPFSCTWAAILRGQGWAGCALLIAIISGMILMPKVYIRAGHLNPIDFENFPGYLKRKIYIVTGLMCGGGVWLAITALPGITPP